MPRQGPELIKKIQDQLKLTQKDLANILGVTQQTVSHYKLGTVKKEQHEVITKLTDLLSKDVSAHHLRRRKSKTSRGADSAEDIIAYIDDSDPSRQDTHRKTKTNVGKKT